MISFSNPSWRKFKNVYTFLNPENKYKLLENIIKEELETKDWVNVTYTKIAPKLDFKINAPSFYSYLKNFKNKKELILVKRKLYYKNVGNELLNTYCIVDMNRLIKNLKDILPIFEISNSLKEQLNEIQNTSYYILNKDFTELETGEMEIK